MYAYIYIIHLQKLVSSNKGKLLMYLAIITLHN